VIQSRNKLSDDMADPTLKETYLNKADTEKKWDVLDKAVQLHKKYQTERNGCHP